MNIATPVQSPLIKQFDEIMPLAFGAATVGTTGLVIVDEINGFATVGAGYLAPPAPNAQVTRMVAETDRLAKAFTATKRPILAFLDTHVPVDVPLDTKFTSVSVALAFRISSPTCVANSLIA